MERIEMNISLNGKKITVNDGTTVGELASDRNPGADLIILNGFPAGTDTILMEGEFRFPYQKRSSPRKRRAGRVDGCETHPGCPQGT